MTPAGGRPLKARSAPVFTGQGGSIPMVADFATAHPDETILVTAVGDPDCRAHSTNESVHLSDQGAACLVEAMSLGGLGE